MIIYHLSAGIGGGAGSSAFRLHVDLQASGLDSRFITWDPPQEKRAMSTPWHGTGWGDRLARALRRFRLRRRLRRHLPVIRQLSEPFSLEETELEPDVSESIPFDCDLIHLHWVSGFVDYRRFFSEVQKRGTPVVWTLWDMNPFTGGCHFDAECGRFVGECGCCPILQSNEEKDLSREVLLGKASALQSFPSSQLHLAASCRWMAGQAEKSRLFSRFPKRVIPTGTDVELFVPMAQDFCREAWSLEKSVPTILFVSDSATNTRKGVSFLLEALRLLGHRVQGVCLLIVGGGTVEVKEIRTVQLGRIADRRSLPSVYNAADLYVCPSLQDNLPNTLLEAMSCGVPSVAFSCGGIPELIEHGVNGLLAETGNAEQLAERLQELLENPELRRRMGVKAAQTVRERFQMSSQVKAYAEYYQQIVAGAPSDASRADLFNRQSEIV